MPRRVVRRQRGKGIIDGLLGALIGGAARKRPARRRKLPMSLGSRVVGVAVKRRRVGAPKRRVMRGAGFFGNLWSGIKNVGSSLLNTAKDRKIVSGALKNAGYNNLAGLAKGVGLGRRRKRMRGGYSLAVMPNSMKMYGSGVHGLYL